MTTLYHYTCDHGRTHLRERGLVVPPRVHTPDMEERLPHDLVALAYLSWFTDLDWPWREALGLTQTLDGMCDRTKYRYRVLEPEPVPWLRCEWRAVAVGLRRLERMPGSMPAHWYVASVPVSVVFDPLP